MRTISPSASADFRLKSSTVDDITFVAAAAIVGALARDHFEYAHSYFSHFHRLLPAIVRLRMLLEVKHVPRFPPFSLFSFFLSPISSFSCRCPASILERETAIHLPLVRVIIRQRHYRVASRLPARHDTSYSYYIDSEETTSDFMA